MTDEHREGMRAAIAWNRANPIGTPVCFWPGKDKTAAAELTRTRSEAWVDADDMVIVNVMGANRVPVALSEPVSADVLAAFEQGLTPDQIMTEEWDGLPYFVEWATWPPSGVGAKS